MKRINLTSFLHTSALALVVAAVAASSATADLIVRDTFSYADGSLTGKTPEIGGTWTNHSGTAGQTQVVSGQASLVQTQGEDNNTAFDTGAIGAGDVIYSGFDLTVPTQANAPATGYFAHFKDAGNFFGSRVFITTPTTSGYRLGISGNSTLSAAETWATDLAFDTTYRVVTSYNYDTGATRMWIDPADESSTSIAADEGFSGDEFLSYAFRQFGTAAAGTSTQRIDNLQVATTFDEASIVVPEPATVALTLLAGLGAVGFRRRRS
jgi:hypothetical protein